MTRREKREQLKARRKAEKRRKWIEKKGRTKVTW